MITPLFGDATTANTIWENLRDVALVASSLAMVGVWIQGRRKQSNKREISPQPLEVTGEIAKAPKRFNAALAEQQHGELKSRIDDHDAEIDKIWFTMRAEDEATRKELRDYVARTNLSLGRIEGKLGTLPKDES